jgi:hypothetical protein
VEFAILLPAFMIVLFGMLEFGFAFSHHLTLEYATREGARVGAALANGTKTAPCLPDPVMDDVDKLIVAAVQRVLTSPGSQVPPARVREITIYKADANGGSSGAENVWVPGSGGNVDGMPLVFVRDGGRQGWNVCTREKFLTPSREPDSLGVLLKYDYDPITPLGSFLKIGGVGPLRITDRTVMALEPFQDG